MERNNTSFDWKNDGWHWKPSTGEAIEVTPSEIRIEGEFVNNYTTPSLTYYGIPKAYYQGIASYLKEEEASEDVYEEWSSMLTKTAMDYFMEFMQKQFYPTRIIYNPPYTICYFGEEKEIVKCSEFDEYKPDFGVMACIMRRLFESRAEFERLVESGSWQEPKEKKDK